MSERLIIYPDGYKRKKRAIVYSLFGAGIEYKNCFSFYNYLQGLAINLRLARLIYPDWEVVLETDTSTYQQYQDLLTALPIVIEINDSGQELCRAMLWRLKPIWHDYTHVLCRDLDSPLTYRERQAVEHWISHGKTGHAITDSVSHTIALMGGMIGFVPEYFKMRTGFASWQAMMADSPINFNVKGSDQDFLNQVIYPKIAGPGNDSITQHYVLGMPNTFLSDYHNHIPAIELAIDPELVESNNTCGHIGAAGYYTGPTFKFLHKYKDAFADLREIEAKYPKIFFWDEEI